MLRILVLVVLLMPVVSSAEDLYTDPIIVEPIPGGTFPQQVEQRDDLIERSHTDADHAASNSAPTVVTVVAPSNIAELQLRLELLRQLLALLQQKLELEQAAQQEVSTESRPSSNRAFTTDPLTIGN